MLITGQIVKSKNGRDAGKYFIITSVEGEYVYLADGKTRKQAKPKKKKIKHVQAADYKDTGLKEKIDGGMYYNDADIRESIQGYLNGEGGGTHVQK